MDIHPGLRCDALAARPAAQDVRFPVLLILARPEWIDSLREQHTANPQAPRGFLAKPFLVEAVQAEVGRLLPRFALRSQAAVT